MIDFAIIGGGLAGTILADYLSAHATVKVLDANAGAHSSKIAAGIFNPVTGRRMAKSWMVDEIGPFALQYYQKHAAQAQEPFVQEKPIHRLFHNAQQREEWLKQVDFYQLEGIITGQIDPQPAHDTYHADFGGVSTGFSWRLDTSAFLSHMHRQQVAIRLQRVFQHQNIHHHDRVWHIEDLTAKNLVFAEGYKLIENPWWNYLPMRPNKGELLVIECPDLEEVDLVQKRIFLLPLGNHRFKVGATYERDNLTLHHSAEKREWLLDRLSSLLKMPFKVVGNEVGIRPAVSDRRPLIGAHPTSSNLWVFNGFGSKGVSQIPWCAQHFVQHLIKNTPLQADLDVRRFDKKLRSS